MRLHKSLMTALMLVLAAGIVPVSAQDKGAPADQKAAMEAMEKAGRPGEQHKGLELLAGSWTTEVKMWMGPGEPMVSKGESESKIIFDGRYLSESYTGDFMGQPFHGTGLSGYDNTLKKYVATWADSGSTGIMTMRGTYDAATKTYTYNGMYPDPSTGKERPARMVVKVTDANKHTMEWWDPDPKAKGKFVRVMEITYTKK